MGHHLVFFSRFKSHQHLIAGGAPGERLQRPGLSRGSSKRAGAEGPRYRKLRHGSRQMRMIYNIIYIYIHNIYNIVYNVIYIYIHNIYI